MKPKIERARCVAMALVLAIGALSGCGHHDGGPMTLELRGDALIANGTIDGRVLEDFALALQENPDITTLVLERVPGSSDDDANLQLARIVHAMGLETVIPAGGAVASGGTDLFLAGRSRRAAPDACIGVHSWAEDEMVSARTIPRDAPVHRIYLRYYRDIGIDTDFYWYTLEVADADDIHWMTGDERSRFAVSTQSPNAYTTPDPEVCDRRLEAD